MRNPRYASPRKLAHQNLLLLLALGVATTRQLCVWAYGELNSAAWYVVGGPSGLLDQDLAKLALIVQSTRARCSVPRRPTVKNIILLVTWLVAGQPPNSYQTTFNSMEACEAARSAVLAEGRRIKAEFEQRVINGAKSMGEPPAEVLMAMPAPSVTAVCAPQ